MRKPKLATFFTVANASGSITANVPFSSLLLTAQPPTTTVGGPTSNVPNTFAAYATKFVDGLSGVDTPGGGASGYLTIQYGLNDWLTQSGRRLVVKPTATYNLNNSTYTTFPADTGLGPAGQYRVLEGDVTNATQPVVNLNNYGFFPAGSTSVATPNISIRWLRGQGSGSNSTPQRPIVHVGYINGGLFEALWADGLYNTNSSNNSGSICYNLGQADAPSNLTFNQCRETNCGCNTTGGGIGVNYGMFYTWGGTNITITNCDANSWCHFLYVKGAYSTPQNLTCYNNKIVYNPASIASQAECFNFQPLNPSGVACPGGILWHHNLIDGKGLGTVVGVVVNNPAGFPPVGAQGTDVEVYNNTIVNVAGGFNFNDFTGGKVYNNVLCPTANIDAMFWATRPPLGGMATQFSVVDYNAWFVGNGTNVSAWQFDRFGSPQTNFAMFSPPGWQTAFTTLSGLVPPNTELLTNPDAHGFIFNTQAGVFTNPAGGDYTPLNPGALINAGRVGGVSGGASVNIGAYDGSNTVGVTWF